jgi:manganese/zinc/iron transport system substrate-binding protein
MYSHVVGMALRTGLAPLLVALVLLLAMGGAASCGREAGEEPRAAYSKENPANVVATIGMIGDVAARIGGERVRVTTLMGAGVDPHLYKASPGDIRMLTGADLILYNGLLLEGKMTDVLVKLAASKPVVAVSERIPEDRLMHPDGSEGHADPHVWFDVALWMIAAERVRDALMELDPAGKDVYTSNASAYLEEMRALDGEVRAKIAAIPEGKRLLVTAHDAFGYFGRAYGIEVRGIQGISTESEASLKDINTLVDDLVARKVPAVFVESSVPRKTIEALIEGAASRGHALVIGGELFSDAMGAPGTPEGTYLGMVRHNVEAIAGALK